MLIEFTFENFKCYKDETTLNMEAAPLAEHAETLIEDKGGRKCLPVSVIYGPNGGGKSSVLQALQCMCSYVTLPYMILRHRGAVKSPILSCNPYAFDVESREKPTTFCALFSTGDYTYRYILSIQAGDVVEEYLHRRKPGKGATATIFEREGGDIKLGSSLQRKGVNTDVDAMMPLLSFLAINYDLEAVEEAFGWMLSCIFIDYSSPKSENMFVEFAVEREKSRVVSLLNGMDIDITDIRYEHNGEGELEGIYLEHANESGAELELEEESNGTKKLLSLVPLALMALDEGALLVSDELDAKLHPKLLKYLIRLFTDKGTNPNGAQLIFTSHDMTTMNSSIFRRDEIWFAARSASGSASLYSLADIADMDGRRVRTQNSYDRQYLSGRYGADPYLKGMLEWEAKDE